MPFCSRAFVDSFHLVAGCSEHGKSLKERRMSEMPFWDSVLSLLLVNPKFGFS